MEDVTLEDILKNLGNRWWRLNHLYYVKDENGNKVLFKPEERQAQVELFNNFWYFTITPKARQLGITTYFAILYLDAVLFSENKTAGIIAHRQEDQKKIFRNKVKFAWENLHPWLRKYIGEPETDSASELVFPNGSTIFVSMTTRSGTVQYLHISEFGYVCQKFPERAEEIVTGAINSVHAGNCVSIESTAAGKEGYFYEYCMTAERNRKEKRELTPLDFKIFFFPWWIDPKYSIEGNVVITKEFEDYFKMLETKHGIKLNTGQKNWYVKKRELMKDKMFAEYPSTLEECFQVTVEGAYFSYEMSKVYKENRITGLPHDPNIEVDTWWDLGMNDFTVILLTQTTAGGQIKFIDMYWNHGHGLAHYYDWLKKRKEEVGYRYGRHHLPHDVEVKDLSTGATRKSTLINMGMQNIRVGKKVSIQEGIERVRQLFPRFWFDETNCQRLHEACFNYRKEFDDKLGVFKDKPRHDDNSHFVDPLRLIAQLWSERTFAHDGDETESSDQSFFS